MARAAAEPLDAVRRQRDLVFGQALLGNDVPVGTLDGVDDLVGVERNLGAAALDDLYAAHTFLLLAQGAWRALADYLHPSAKGHTGHDLRVRKFRENLRPRCVRVAWSVSL